MSLDHPLVAAAAGLLFLVSNVVIFSQVAHFEQLSGGMGLLELPNHLGSDLQAVAQAYPAAARDHYRTVLLPLDMVHPATAGLLFATLLTMLSRRAAPAGHALRRLPWLGLALVVADWVENGCVAVLLAAPDDPGAVASLAKVAIGAKWAVVLTTGLATAALATRTLGTRILRGHWPVDAPGTVGGKAPR